MSRAEAMPTLHAPDLVLEPLVAAHAEAMFAVLRAPQLYRYLDEAPPPSVAWLRERYARLESRASADGRERWLNWVLRLRDGEAIGYVQATVLEDACAWLAYVLAPAHWGRGHVTAATQAVIDHLAQAHGVRRFLATVDAGNERSIRLLRRLGFEEAPAHEVRRRGINPQERLFAR